ncbi:MAG TPA: sigma-54-dependent Fis family transcriptional regulator, partial [Desulfurivibrio alkaliphilus]|nr:sigma-54-dependent Fis family transcriptional regulator [Desulfurivibrio alkaliphilus]
LPVAPRPSPLPTLRHVREEALEQAEQRYLNDLLGLTGGDMEKACAISGLSRSQLYRIMQKHRIKRKKDHYFVA